MKTANDRCLISLRADEAQLLNDALAELRYSEAQREKSDEKRMLDIDVLQERICTCEAAAVARSNAAQAERSLL